MNISNIHINPIRWFKKSGTPKIDALSVAPKGDTVGIYGKSGIHSTQEDNTVPEIAKQHPHPQEQAPGYFAEGTEAKVPAKSIGPLTPQQALDTGADNIVVHSDGSASLHPGAAIPAGAPTPPKEWFLDGKTFTDEAAASAQADADQRAKNAAVAAPPPPVTLISAQEPIMVVQAKPTLIVETSPSTLSETIPEQPVSTAAPAKESTLATTVAVPAPKETIGQDIGNFFKKLLVGIDKGFAFIDKIEVAAQPVIAGIDAAIAPIDPPLAAEIAAGAGLVNGVFSVVGSVLNTITTVGATNATPAQKMAAALPAIEQEILSDPTLAKAITAVGGNPTNIAQFNASLTAAAQALYLLTTAI